MEGTKKGERLLGHPFKRVGDKFPHKYHRDIWFSFWLAPYEISGLRLRTVDDILAHDNCPPETRAESRPSSTETRTPDPENISGRRGAALV